MIPISYPVVFAASDKPFCVSFCSAAVIFKTYGSVRVLVLLRRTIYVSASSLALLNAAINLPRFHYTITVTWSMRLNKSALEEPEMEKFNSYNLSSVGMSPLGHIRSLGN